MLIKLNKIFSMNKKTLVLGGSENPARYSNLAIKSLRKYGHDVVSIGTKIGKVDDVDIVTTMPFFDNIDTITLYLRDEFQKKYYDYIISLNPKRIIFNPGTENDELVELAKKNNIETEEACTLVLLNLRQY